MSCSLEFAESSVKIDFCNKGNKQKILIDVLIKYSEMDINELALTLDVSVKKLHDICERDDFLVGAHADNLAELFLKFFGRHFFKKCTLIRSFY